MTSVSSSTESINVSEKIADEFLRSTYVLDVKEVNCLGRVRSVYHAIFPYPGDSSGGCEVYFSKLSTGEIIQWNRALIPKKYTEWMTHRDVVSFLKFYQASIEKGVEDPFALQEAQDVLLDCHLRQGSLNSLNPKAVKQLIAEKNLPFYIQDEGQIQTKQGAIRSSWDAYRLVWEDETASLGLKQALFSVKTNGAIVEWDELELRNGKKSYVVVKNHINIESFLKACCGSAGHEAANAT